MPYRTLDDRIDGVVITFADITIAKKLELQLREQQAVLEKHLSHQATQPAPPDEVGRQKNHPLPKARVNRQP
jgi:hypothetical protein